MICRNVTIDIVKGLGIILVVLGHNSWVGSPDNAELSRVIFSFHVPLFFFLSGIFLRESDDLRSFLWSKADSLLKPYFVVLIFLGVLKLILSIAMNLVEAPTFQYILGVLWGNGITIPWPPLWFLSHLFISLSFSFFVLKLTKGMPILYLILIVLLMFLIGLSAISLFWLPTTFINAPVTFNSLPGLPWGLDITLITSTFILAGYMLHDKIKNFNFNLNIFFVALVIFTSMHYYFDETIDLNMRSYGNSVISSIQAITGIYITISIAALLNRYKYGKKMLSYLGSGSLFILIFHSSAQGKAFKILSHLINYPFLNCIVSFTVGLGFSIILWEIAKKQKIIGFLLLPKKHASQKSHVQIVADR